MLSWAHAPFHIEGFHPCFLRFGEGVIDGAYHCYKHPTLRQSTLWRSCRQTSSLASAWFHSISDAIIHPVWTSWTQFIIASPHCPSNLEDFIPDSIVAHCLSTQSNKKVVELWGYVLPSLSKCEHKVFRKLALHIQQGEKKLMHSFILKIEPIN